MSPRTAGRSEAMIEWAERHRCFICDAPPVRVESELIEPYRVLRPEYRYLASIAAPAEGWQTDLIGGEYRMDVECENGHVFTATYVKLRDYAYPGRYRYCKWCRLQQRRDDDGKWTTTR